MSYVGTVQLKSGDKFTLTADGKGAVDHVALLIETQKFAVFAAADGICVIATDQIVFIHWKPK